jgi:hypothetical protein
LPVLAEHRRRLVAEEPTFATERRRRLVLGNRSFLSEVLVTGSDPISICSHYNDQLASEFLTERKSRVMDDLTSRQEEAVAATVGAVQRIAMAIVELPKEGRAAHYAMVRRKFEAAMMEVGIGVR